MDSPGATAAPETHMILEIADIRIRPASMSAFDAAIRRGI
jgi:hypothetical protein